MTNGELYKLRNDLHMSQEAFANKIGISRSYLNRLENGKAHISENLVLKISSIFAPHSTPSKYLIPFFDIDATATPLEIFEDNSSFSHTKLDLPGFSGADFAIKISGHALHPAIENGSMIICKKVKDKSIILFGEIYFLVTSDYRFVRRIKKSNKKGHVLLVADEQAYESIEIPIDKIIHLYIVKGAIKRLTP